MWLALSWKIGQFSDWKRKSLLKNKNKGGVFPPKYKLVAKWIWTAKHLKKNLNLLECHRLSKPTHSANYKHIYSRSAWKVVSCHLPASPEQLLHSNKRTLARNPTRTGIIYPTVELAGILRQLTVKHALDEWLVRCPSLSINSFKIIPREGHSLPTLED